MKKLTAFCGVALLSFASINAQADIQPMNDAALSEVEGQLGLIDSTRFIVGAHVVGAHVVAAHVVGAYLAHEAVETAVRLKVAHEVVETGARIAAVHVAGAYVAHEAVETGARLVAAGAAGAFVAHEIVEHHRIRRHY